MVVSVLPFTTSRMEKRTITPHMENFTRFLEDMDQEKSLYIFDYDTATNEGPEFLDITMSSLATLGPDKRRYKEFVKNSGGPRFQHKGALTLYMPVWKLNELLQAGKYLKNTLKLESRYYDKDAIQNSYKSYGGIYRYVFDTNPFRRDANDNAYEDALGAADATKIVRLNSIDQYKVSHCPRRYAVLTEGADAFINSTTDFSSKCVYEKLLKRMSEVNIEDKVAVLMKNDQVPTSMPGLCYKYYEDVVFESLTHKAGLKA